VSRRLLSAAVIVLCAIILPAADGPIEPLTVCEVLKDLPTHDGKNLAVLGRFSFRRDGRTLNEGTCGEKDSTGEHSAPPALRLMDDSKSGPKPPDVYALDGAAVNRKLKAMQEHTTLGKFRFGTPDYDRWAVVYGRIEADKTTPSGSAGSSPAARLVFRGDGVVLFLHDN
jgi:hypothetical protein